MGRLGQDKVVVLWFSIDCVDEYVLSNGNDYGGDDVGDVNGA